MRRDRNYVTQKFATQKRVTLPDGRTFLARCKRVKRSELPRHIVMRREYRQRPRPRGRRRRRRGQQGQGIFDFIKKVAKNPIVRSVAKKGLEYASGI